MGNKEKEEFINSLIIKPEEIEKYNKFKEEIKYLR